MRPAGNGERVLLTGGGGYIGVILADELLRNGYAVRILDTLYWGRQPLAGLEGPIEIIQDDLRRIDARVLQGVSAVIHQGGLSNDPMAEFNPTANFAINTDATVRLAQLCKEVGVARFTFASSASVYDRGLTRDTCLQDETTPVEPTAAYSLSKYRAERALLDLADAAFEPVIVRQGTVYGFSPRMRYDLVVNTMVKSALQTGTITVLGGGEQWRPLVDVRDVARAHVAALAAPREAAAGQIFNLVHDNYQMIGLAQRVGAALREAGGVEPTIVIDHAPRPDRSYRIAGDKIRQALGWSPQIAVEESIATMVRQLRTAGYANYGHPRFYNIEWMKLLDETAGLIATLGRVF